MCGWSAFVCSNACARCFAMWYVRYASRVSRSDMGLRSVESGLGIGTLCAFLALSGISR